MTQKRWRIKTFLYFVHKKPRSDSSSTLGSNTDTSSIESITISTDGSFQSSASSTDNTLSMISTPWSTESWYSNSFLESSCIWNNSEETTYSSVTVFPKSTTSYGVPSPTFHTNSATTVTLLGDSDPSSDSYEILPLVQYGPWSESGTLTSWTLETFTSVGKIEELNSRIVIPNYPWSPCTVSNSTDFYPSTVDSLVSRKQSRVTLTDTSNRHRRELTPMSYFLLNPKQE